MIVFSFYVDRRRRYPDAPEYVPLLRVLDDSCRRLGIRHVVLTDFSTAGEVERAGMTTFAMKLPGNLMRALTESQARCLESVRGEDVLFVGADCVVLRDPRGCVPAADLALILRPGHKRHRINNGFMYVPASSREKTAPVFRRIANTCGTSMCDDMVAVERVLLPMPDDYGSCRRAGIDVQFLPMGTWNAGPKSVDSPPSSGAFVAHFRGRDRKKFMADWASRWAS